MTNQVNFQKGDVVVYEYKNANDGRKFNCRIVAIDGDWFRDQNQGTYFSTSFRLQDVIVWEVYKAKK